MTSAISHFLPFAPLPVSSACSPPYQPVTTVFPLVFEILSYPGRSRVKFITFPFSTILLFVDSFDPRQHLQSLYDRQGCNSFQFFFLWLTRFPGMFNSPSPHTTTIPSWFLPQIPTIPFPFLFSPGCPVGRRARFFLLFVCTSEFALTSAAF